MAYKIKNVTNLLDKRNSFLNTSVEIDYLKKGVIKEVIKLNVGEELIFESDFLPISVDKLKMKKHIRVTKITNNDVHGLKSTTPQSQAKQHSQETSEKGQPKTNKHKYKKGD